MLPPIGFSFVRLLLAAFLTALTGVGTARADWLVFEARFQVEDDQSLNFAPYTGAYIIAPISGGAASFIFTTEVDGRFYSVAENSGKYFTIANVHGRRAVISALAQNGSAKAMYQASGLLNSTLPYLINGERKAALIPTDISGRMLASDDESSAVQPGADGSIGMTGSALIKGTLRMDLTRILNQKPSSMLDAIESVTSLLEKYAYLPDGTVLAPATTSLPKEPVPTPPAAERSDASLFPAGSREEMDRTLEHFAK